MTAKVAIVGSGIAAISAAIEARERGAEVTMIRGRPGATALSSGAWDIAGCPTRHAGLKWHQSPSPSENLDEMVRRHPNHPYALLSRTGEGIESLLQQAFNRLSNRFDFRLRGTLAKNLLVLNPLGGVKFTAFVPPSHIGGNLLEMREARLLIVGLRGLPYFSASAVASFLKEIHARQGFPYLSQIAAAEVRVSNLPETFSPVAVASALDDDEAIESLHQTLIREAERHQATHIALPPVIGVRKTEHILSRLKEASGLSWFEALGLPPSIPGLRLQRQIDQLLEDRRRLPCEVIEGQVVGAVKKGKRIESVRVRDGDEVPVQTLILATGRYIGGGIVKEKAFREPILDLPLFSGGERVSEIFAGRLLSERFLSDHRLFSVGVRTNPNLQPVGDRGEVLYENVWAAGSLIGGYNPATQHCGMGVAVATGTAAGRSAAQ